MDSKAQDFRELLQEDERYGKFGGGMRIFKAIRVGTFELSIQASETHYCSPRRVLDVYAYGSFEVALFKKGKWVNPNKDARFSEFADIAEPSGNTCILPYMSVADVQRLYETILTITG